MLAVVAQRSAGIGAARDQLSALRQPVHFRQDPRGVVSYVGGVPQPVMHLGRVFPPSVRRMCRSRTVRYSVTVFGLQRCTVTCFSMQRYASPATVWAGAGGARRGSSTLLIRSIAAAYALAVSTVMSLCLPILSRFRPTGPLD